METRDSLSILLDIAMQEDVWTNTIRDRPFIGEAIPEWSLRFVTRMMRDDAPSYTQILCRNGIKDPYHRAALIGLACEYKAVKVCEALLERFERDLSLDEMSLLVALLCMISPYDMVECYAKYIDIIVVEILRKHCDKIPKENFAALVHHIDRNYLPLFKRTAMSEKHDDIVDIIECFLEPTGTKVIKGKLKGRFALLPEQLYYHFGLALNVICIILFLLAFPFVYIKEVFARKKARSTKRSSRKAKRNSHSKVKEPSNVYGVDVYSLMQHAPTSGAPVQTTLQEQNLDNVYNAFMTNLPTASAPAPAHSHMVHNTTTHCRTQKLVQEEGADTSGTKTWAHTRYLVSEPQDDPDAVLQDMNI